MNPTSAHPVETNDQDLEEPKTLVEGAYRQLRRDIIEGRHPPGEKLRVEHLKDQYQVGAGTLREALALLVSDSLVVAQGQRGFRVAPISLTDIEDITRTRVLLECEALRLSIASGDDAWEAEVVSAFHRLTRAEEKLAADVAGAVNEWEERNRIFHEKLIGACRSRWTKQFLGVLYQQSERYRRISVLNRPVPRDVHEEHEEIFEATIARDSKRATKLLAGHILRTFKAIQSLASLTAGSLDSMQRASHRTPQFPSQL
jgi:DNA-binding GntR family transcriptional regulator